MAAHRYMLENKNERKLKLRLAVCWTNLLFNQFAE